MFTGIIESLGTISNVVRECTNVHFNIESKISSQLKVDQSVAHNGVCLTVTSIKNNTHTVTAVEETLKKTNLSDWKEGDLVNLERCMQMNGRLDGHIVQGHVDQIGKCVNKLVLDGSWLYDFEYDSKEAGHVTVEKGSITINGTSLTCFNTTEKGFSVTIIPYTFENTVFKTLESGDKVNLEFDIIGKYVSKLLNKN
ncbi:riboflavin synthase [Reichenbachiella versicolor]|uniref:riboflavin synthase n=1 Tax=Reichenbachiella versicolor TaxID=1821036 RepID=UPI000D6E39A8|nr:riboflavin synthase [Reichenbachiella versicolor]